MSLSAIFCLGWRNAGSTGKTFSNATLFDIVSLTFGIYLIWSGGAEKMQQKVLFDK